MTVRAMTTDDQIADLVRVRDALDREAFYYRRRAVDTHDRQHAIDLEEHVAVIDDVVANLRLERQAERRAEEAE